MVVHNILHEAWKYLFGIIIDFGTGKTDARAVESSPSTPLQLFVLEKLN